VQFRSLIGKFLIRKKGKSVFSVYKPGDNGLGLQILNNSGEFGHTEQ
jgi:hypothetical protein